MNRKATAVDVSKTQHRCCIDQTFNVLPAPCDMNTVLNVEARKTAWHVTQTKIDACHAGGERTYDGRQRGKDLDDWERSARF